jgi:purine nucleosidase
MPRRTPVGGNAGYYFRFYEGIFGRPCSAMHDPLAAALAVGGVKAAVAPVVHAAVDTTGGPGRGQTVCDLRGLYGGHPEVPGARCRVVLSLDGDFAPHLVEVLLSLTESTTSAPGAGAAAA